MTFCGSLEGISCPNSVASLLSSARNLCFWENCEEQQVSILKVGKAEPSDQAGLDALQSQVSIVPLSLFHKLTTCNSIILQGYSPADAILSFVTSSLGSHWSNLKATDHFLQFHPCDWSSRHNYTGVAGLELELSSLSLPLTWDLGVSSIVCPRIRQRSAWQTAARPVTPPQGLPSLTELVDTHENHRNLVTQQSRKGNNPNSDQRSNKQKCRSV